MLNIPFTDKKKCQKTTFISSVTDATKTNSNEQAIIYGEAVFFALDSTGRTPEHNRLYIEQPSRPASLKLSFNNSDKLRVWILADLLNVSKQLKIKPKLSIDYLLHWGFEQKKDLIIIMTSDNDTGTLLDILVFKDGQLINTQVLNLFARSHRDFSYQIDLALDDLSTKYAHFALAFAPPLDDLLKESLNGRVRQEIGSELFNKRLGDSLDYSQKAYYFRPYQYAVGIFSLTLMVYAAFVGYTWTDYQKAKTDYQAVSVAATQVDEVILKKLQAKHDFLIAAQAQLDTVSKVKRITTAIASVDNVQIKKLMVKSNMSNDANNIKSPADAGFEVVVAVPLNRNMSDLEQIHPVLDHLSASIGTQLNLIKQEEIFDSLSKQKQLLITFQGL